MTAVDGRYALPLRAAVPAEDWNAQLSLMTGMAAARLMLAAGVGVLRTLPAPDDALVDGSGCRRGRSGWRGRRRSRSARCCAVCAATSPASWR